jgi:hypothetical protein
VTGYWRRLHNEELYVLYCSPNIIRVIKPRIMRWAGHVVRVGERRIAYRILWGNLRGRDHLELPDLEGRVVLRLIFREWVGGMDWIDLAQDRDRWRALVSAVMNFRFP